MNARQLRRLRDDEVAPAEAYHYPLMSLALDAFVDARCAFTYPADHAAELAGVSEAMIDAFTSAAEDGVLTEDVLEVVRPYAGDRPSHLSGRFPDLDYETCLRIAILLDRVDADSARRFG